MITKNHDDYNGNIDYWTQTRVFTKGHKGVQQYLYPVTLEADPQSVERNIYYKARAKYTNFAKRTKNALVGAVFRKNEKIELPTKLEYLRLNANGAGKTLNNVAKNIVTNIVEVGRHGIFVDYGNNAKIITYTAENITDWAEDDSGVLNYVQLVIASDSKDEYIKELHIIEDTYMVAILKNGIIINEFTPTKFDGSTFKEIPFIFVGSVDNTPTVDEIPLWSIVDVSQGHYQNSADYEDILRYQLPTPYITGMTKSYIDQVYPNGFIEFGSGAMITAPDGASVGLLQANANQMHQVAMNEKENQLVMLGARLVQGGGQAETAEAVRIKYSAENGILSNLVGNVTSAMLKALSWCGEFEGTDEEIEYEINQDFWDASLSAQEISAEILLLDRGVKAMSDVRNTLRDFGSIKPERTDEDIDADVEVTGGGLDND